MSKPRMHWDSVASNIAADPAATLALDRAAWEALGARFRSVDDGQGETPGLATASLSTPVGSVRIGIVDYGGPSTYLLVPGRDPERADAIEAVVETLLASGALRAREQVLDLAGGVSKASLSDRVTELEMRLAGVEADLRAGVGSQSPDVESAASTSAGAEDASGAHEMLRMPLPRRSRGDGLYMATADVVDHQVGGRVRSVAFGSRGTVIAIAGSDGVRLWNLSSAAADDVLEGHHGAVWAVACSPQRETFVSAGADSTVRLWDVETRSNRVLSGHTGWVGGVAFSPDGSTIASGGDDGTLRLWSAADGVQMALLVHGGDWIVAVAFSPGGRTVASASYGGRVRLWDRATGAQHHVLGGTSGPVNGIAFSPDGWLVACAGSDGTVTLWNAVTGAQHRVLYGHGDSVGAVTFSADGRTLASGSHDGTVRLWDVASGAMRGILGGHTGRVRTVALSPDGRALASAGDDGIVRLWRQATDRIESAQTPVLSPGEPEPPRAEEH